MERARALALELRKYLASSAVQPATLPEMVFETQEEDVLVTVEEAPALEEELVIDLESLAEPQAQEIRALEVAEEKRRLEELVLRYAPFWTTPGRPPCGRRWRPSWRRTSPPWRSSRSWKRP